jgi:hypothetical protein
MAATVTKHWGKPANSIRLITRASFTVSANSFCRRPASGILVLEVELATHANLLDGADETVTEAANFEDGPI